MKWAEMTARERDALVAEKVMGFAKVSFVTSRDGGIVMRPSGKPFIDMTKVPMFTTDISAAWEVVEKMLSQQFSVEVKHWAYPGATWLGEVRGIQAFADTAPEAICIAALRAVGVDVE